MKKKYNGLKKTIFNEKKKFWLSTALISKSEQFFLNKNGHFEVIFLSVNRFGKYKNWSWNHSYRNWSVNLPKVWFSKSVNRNRSDTETDRYSSVITETDRSLITDFILLISFFFIILLITTTIIIMYDFLF
jgi:hypothetical protein